MLLKGALRPLKWILIPIKFFADRLLVLSCFNFLTAEGRARRRLIAQQRQQEVRPWWSVSFKGKSSKNVYDGSSNKFVSVKGVSMKFALETEQSFKDHTLGDELNETPWTDRFGAALKKDFNERKRRFFYWLDKTLSTLPIVIFMKVKWRIFLNYLYAEKMEVSY